LQKHSQKDLDAESDSIRDLTLGEIAKKNTTKRDWTLSRTAIRDFTFCRWQKPTQERLDAESDSHKRFYIGIDCKNAAKRDWTLSLTAIRGVTYRLQEHSQEGLDAESDSH
jgi:hypothetical protein